MNNEKASIQYIGIYEVLDELIKRMKETKSVGDFERYVCLFVNLYKAIGDKNE